jgi:hypothetical protein
VLHLLRIRTHSPLTWDERYPLFIRRAGFLPLGRHVTASLTLMDSATLMALMHRWCLETHKFHLPCGDTMVTLQDVTIILSLPIDSTPVCGPVSLAGWRDFVGAIIPPLRHCRKPQGQELSGNHSGWLTTNFDTYLLGAEDGVIQRYARSCLLHMADELLFSNLILFLCN